MRCDGSESTTQQLLNGVISRPKLTIKLLSKPPFRFLHDVIVEVIRTTGFATNLYTKEEMQSSNVVDKKSKTVFLEKIIKTVGLQLSTPVLANPLKIVAGSYPQDTNNFLQLLAIAAKHSADSSATVRTVLEGMRMGDALPAQNANDEAIISKREANIQEDQSPNLAQVRKRVFAILYSLWFVYLHIYFFCNNRSTDMISNLTRPQEARGSRFIF